MVVDFASALWVKGWIWTTNIELDPHLWALRNLHEDIFEMWNQGYGLENVLQNYWVWIRYWCWTRSWSRIGIVDGT